MIYIVHIIQLIILNKGITQLNMVEQAKTLIRYSHMELALTPEQILR